MAQLITKSAVLVVTLIVSSVLWVAGPGNGTMVTHFENITGTRVVPLLSFAEGNVQMIRAMEEYPETGRFPIPSYLPRIMPTDIFPLPPQEPEPTPPSEVTPPPSEASETPPSSQTMSNSPETPVEEHVEEQVGQEPEVSVHRDSEATLEESSHPSLHNVQTLLVRDAQRNPVLTGLGVGTLLLGIAGVVTSIVARQRQRQI